jgi:hypothetical protein
MRASSLAMIAFAYHHIIPNDDTSNIGVWRRGVATQRSQIDSALHKLMIG